MLVTFLQFFFWIKNLFFELKKTVGNEGRKKKCTKPLSCMNILRVYLAIIPIWSTYPLSGQNTKPRTPHVKGVIRAAEKTAFSRKLIYAWCGATSCSRFRCIHGSWCAKKFHANALTHSFSHSFICIAAPT